MHILEYNGIDHEWKVLEKGFAIGNGKTIEDAIASARTLTDRPIYQLDENLDYVEVKL